MKFVEDSSDLSIDYNQFIAVFIKEKSLKSQKNLWNVFKLMDYDGNSLIDKQQLQSILMKMGARKRPFKQIQINKEVNDIFSAADKNNDGVIDFEEFKATILQDF